MGNMSKAGRSSNSGKFVPVGIAARERTLARSSARYIFAGGKGQAAYDLSKIIAGAERPTPLSRMLRTGKK